MMKQTRRLFAVMAAVVVLGLFALPVAAQPPVAAVVDRSNIATGEQLTLSVIVDAAVGQPGQPVLPALDGFELLSAASGTQISTVNGARTVQVIYQYVLQPLRTGQLVIDPIAVDLGGQVYRTDPIAVTVSQGSGLPGSGASGAGASGGLGMFGGLGSLSSLMGSGMDPFALLDQLTGASGGMLAAPDATTPAIEAPAGLLGQDYLVEASVDNAGPYQGEQVAYTVRVYQAVSPMGQIDYRPPSFTGFWSKQQPDQTRYRTQAAGRDYWVTELRTLLFPTMAGEVQIDPVRLVIPGGFFDAGGELSSQPVALNIKALPAGAPAGFGGAVGRFQIDAAVDKNAAKVGDTVTQQVRISGVGNLETLADPQWPDSPDWRAFESKAQTDTTMLDGKLAGTRTYDRVLMPTAPGSAGLPAIEFTYFDPASGEYHTVSTAALAVTVAPDGAAAQASQASSASLAPSVAGPGTAVNARPAARPAVRPIQAAPASWQAGVVVLPRQSWYWLLWGLPLLLLAGQTLVQRRQLALQANSAQQRGRLARRQAHQALAAARNHPDLAAWSAEDILTTYLAGRLDRPVVGLTQQELL